MKTLYTAEAVVEGGRQGHGRTSDGRLDVDLSVPVEMSGAGGPGTNPEQLFAVGYAACFQSALMGVARGQNLDASDSRITSRVGLRPTGHGGFTLSVSLDLHAPRVSPAQAGELMAQAHQRCPYANAARGRHPDGCRTARSITGAGDHRGRSRTRRGPDRDGQSPTSWPQSLAEWQRHGTSPGQDVYSAPGGPSSR